MDTKLTTRIIRIRDNGNATYGVWSVYHGREEVLQVVTLEPSAFFNLKYVSCIPCGKYHVKKRTSPKHGDHFHFQDVKGRTFVLAHAGNLYTQTEGCVIPGEYFGYVNNDGIMDVKGSKNAMRKLNEVLPDEFIIHVLEHEHMQRMYTTDKPVISNPV